MPRLAIHQSPNIQLETFADVVRKGLSRTPKSLPPRFFYDARGSELFDKICQLPEYYLTRTETALLRSCFKDATKNEISTIIELGSGSADKTKILFNELKAHPSITFVPIDISKDAIEESSSAILAEYDNVKIHAQVAEYDQSFETIKRYSDIPSLVLFLGSNIGNFTPSEAINFLDSIRQNIGKDSKVIIGFDMQKSESVLKSAYNDINGVTAEFNLNLLSRINRELGGEFILKQFRHNAFYNKAESRIEMHLVSEKDQEVRINEIDKTIYFEKNETIHTENSYKFSLEQIEQLASQSRFTIEKMYTDDKKWFSLVIYKPV